MPELKRNLAYLLTDKSRLVRRRFDEYVRDHEITGPQARLLLFVERNPGQRQAAYADALDVEPMTLCRMVDRLEENGWIKRSADPVDRRARLLAPTAKSREITESLRDSVDSFLDDLLAGLDVLEREQLERLLAKVGSMEVANEAPGAVHG